MFEHRHFDLGSVDIVEVGKEEVALFEELPTVGEK